MAVGPGTRLGPYDILSPLGAGGMGEVYKARDSRLDRTVAIKVLPAALASDPQFRDRFEREAKTISQLDHPNICTLYDIGAQDGTSFLVMQYLEGETLADRLGRSNHLRQGSGGPPELHAKAEDRPLPVDEALAIAIQIADALTTAHRAGIVHRDLKPGNVMLTRSSAGSSGSTQAKLLDFGLAKTGVPAVSGTGGTMLPTTPVNITAQGTILGTFQYMAPEQLEGADADARTDIFAFGAIVYEMVTGRKAFEGKSPVSLIGAILERDPAPLSTIAPTVPASLDRVIRRCLAKDPDRRWQSASDLAHELRWISETASAPEVSATPTAAPPAPAKSKTTIWWKVATAASIVAALAGFAAAFAARVRTPEVVRFFIDPPEKASFVSGGRPGASAAISPDGRRIVFTVSDSSQKILLWLRSIDALIAQPLPGTDDASFPFWSPDSKSIAYFARDRLMKVEASGGPPQTLCDAPGGRGGAWSREGDILFGAGGPGTDGGSPLSRVSSAGGQPMRVTRLSPGQMDHRFPSFLPDGRHFLFYANSLGAAGAASESEGIYLGSLDSPDSRRIMSAESSAVHSAGHLLFVRQSTLLAQPFNLTRFELSGDPVPVGEQVTRTFTGLIAFSVSDGGALAYGHGPSQSAPGTDLQLTWVDRQGKGIETIGPPGTYRGIDLSPDGKRVAVHRHEGTGGDLWIIDATRSERFTFDPTAENESPVWSPDGEWIAFGARKAQKPGLYRKPSNLAGGEELLLEPGPPLAPTSWSPDGQSIVYGTGAPGRGQSDVFMVPLSGDRRPIPVLSAPVNESHGQISPNGKWLAYHSGETRRPPEIYVRPLAGGAGKYQVSTNGGMFPRWRSDGRELFYIEATLGPSLGGKLMAVDIGPSVVSLDRGSPRALFDSGYNGFLHPPGGTYNPFAVSRDGQRFLIPRPPSAVTPDQADAGVAVVLNWAAALTRH